MIDQHFGLLVSSNILLLHQIVHLPPPQSRLWFNTFSVYQLLPLAQFNNGNELLSKNSINTVHDIYNFGLSSVIPFDS